MYITKKELEEIWNTVPPDYYQKGEKENFLQRIWHTGKLKAVLNFIDQKPHNILDIGCASGWFLSKIGVYYPDTKLVGIDVYKKAIEYGSKQYKFLELIHADGHKIPFPDRSFDLIICTEVLEHVVNPKLVLNEIKRVLTPCGAVIIEMDTGNFLFRLVWYFWTHLRRGVWHHAHIQIFNTEKLEKIIKQCGFSIKKKKIFNFSMAVAFRIVKK